jgi:hypothetical protein
MKHAVSFFVAVLYYVMLAGISGALLVVDGARWIRSKLIRLLVPVLVMLVLLLGCSSKPAPAPITAVDIQGYKYKLVQPARQHLKFHTRYPALWERIEPPDPNHWYTPSLASQVNPDSSKVFIPLAR